MDLGGYPGHDRRHRRACAASADEIEREGMRRALARAEHADLKLLVFDGGTWPGIDARDREAD